ncbi:MAG: DUF427 domain-containing protein [Gammaproteobacteria bacterium]|nr:DUF427 domain-containing protein [Gammaproteobacteria bacterium]
MTKSSPQTPSQCTSISDLIQIPDYSLLPSPRWVRTFFNGQLVADSREMVLFFERPYPNYFFPRRHVRMDYLHKSDYIESREGRGESEFWHLEVDGKRAENAAFSHLGHGMGEYLTFKWTAMERWLEEDEEIFVHARNPYHRVDALPSSRHIEVMLEGVQLAASRTPVLLFETGLPTRYYLPREDVCMELLETTDTVTRCPYKGMARTFGVRLAEQLYPDYAWSYPAPLAACAGIENRICFYNEVVDISEDGEPLCRPVTHFK